MIKTIDLKNPRPYLKTVIEIFTDKEDRVIHKRSFSELVFRSYTNSLVTNKVAVVPSFKDSLGLNLNEEAFTLYKNNRLKVVFSPADYSVREGGAIHCLTSQVPSL